MTFDPKTAVYIVTDVEANGPLHGTHSMLAFASVAVSAEGERFGEFEAVLKPLEGATADTETMSFWQKFPEAWAAATQNPEDPEKVMRRFVEWVRQFGDRAVFTAHPAGFDGPWIDYYLKRFTGERLTEGFWRTQRLFRGAPFCLISFAAGRLGRSPLECGTGRYPPEWLGNVAHTHRAIDDARGYAHFLVYLMKLKTSLNE